MPHAEDDLLPISALQHLLFCERQAALIHVERLWVENRLTVEGAALHRNAHSGRPETRDGERIVRGLPLRSLEHGLTGVADVVIYRPPDGTPDRQVARRLREAGSAGLDGWRVTPVEYKRGRPKRGDADRVQLCAQALCLEEAHATSIPAGLLFYGRTQRRTPVEFDATLRETTLNAAGRLREIFDNRLTPPARREKKCDACSLLPVCLPAALERRSAKAYVDRMIGSAEEITDA